MKYSRKWMWIIGVLGMMSCADGGDEAGGLLRGADARSDLLLCLFGSLYDG